MLYVPVGHASLQEWVCTAESTNSCIVMLTSASVTFHPGRSLSVSMTFPVWTSFLS